MPPLNQQHLESSGSPNPIQQVFFSFLQGLKFSEENLDSGLLEGHLKRLEILAGVGNWGTNVFDLHQKKVVFFSPNFGNQLGYKPADYEGLNYRFFEARVHLEDQLPCALNGISALKLLASMSPEDKRSHKIISEYRMQNSEGEYVRMVEQYQVLELDKTGQIWLLLSILDVSPDQSNDNPVQCKLLNFKSGQFVSLSTDAEPALELSPREMEVLQLVRQGLLSKEISDRLSISVHTVNTHRQRLLEKLGANNSMEAVAFASRMGLLQ